ncbi:MULTISPECIES: lytic transglycosylase domain-containing protein [unclassified Mesorhizobium]|uniref:lytic transglycosylase domain-containing protein n=1 Tax=unclassified Mesorhizobium TaxID=325217 RepID=UPI00121BD639|nr:MULTISPECIES: lytic transglycosylase domain-containing protein [unclassified Mesorhizobium]MDG4887832.1 lytic transglycosylase domain-containing protein [Mesorhizobium sp. WSM4887]TIQ07677.1 MAG: lytic transglycosylase domain-containing protein [Mesorhizobium sp.]TJW06705.1 MAG: lytic transglycosylase domain-containing protein [Mesorhizobium sp.]
MRTHASRAIWRPALILLGGLHVNCILPANAPAQSSPVATLTARGRYDTHIAEAAKRFRLPPTWIRAVLGAESAGDQRATSRKGAMGLMQIVPETWSDLRVRYQLGSDPYDPHDNIIAGSAYIRELVDRYGSPGWIAAYNAGPGRYEASLEGRRLPAETRAYVSVVSSAISKDGVAKATCFAASARYGWRYAPLFATQLGGSLGDCSLQMERSRDNASRALPLQGLTGAASRSTGLFVPKAGERSAP